MTRAEAGTETGELFARLEGRTCECFEDCELAVERYEGDRAVVRVACGAPTARIR